MPKLPLILATASSMLCMLALFAVAALAAGTGPQPSAQDGVKTRPAPQGVCFLHDLL